MAKPTVTILSFASGATYTAGTFSGLTNKTPLTAAFALQGHYPGIEFPFPANYWNFQLNAVHEIAKWSDEDGTPIAVGVESNVERDSSGHTAVRRLVVELEPGAFDGIDSTGGVTSGAGGVFTGGAGGGRGVFGESVGNNFGGEFHASGTSAAVRADGGGAGGTGDGIDAVGGTSSRGGTFLGMGTAAGLRATGGAGGPGVQAFAGPAADADGLEATGDLTGAGVDAFGGASAGGHGLKGTGGAGGGHGALAVGTGAFAGVDATGGATSSTHGVEATGGAGGGRGVNATAILGFAAVKGTGSATAGSHGVLGQASMNATSGVKGITHSTTLIDTAGVRGEGLNLGYGVAGVAVSGAGVHAENDFTRPAISILASAGDPTLSGDTDTIGLYGNTLEGGQLKARIEGANKGMWSSRHGHIMAYMSSVTLTTTSGAGEFTVGTTNFAFQEEPRTAHTIVMRVSFQSAPQTPSTMLPTEAHTIRIHTDYLGGGDTVVFSKTYNQAVITNLAFISHVLWDTFSIGAGQPTNGFTVTVQRGAVSAENTHVKETLVEIWSEPTA